MARDTPTAIQKQTMQALAKGRHSAQDTRLVRRSNIRNSIGLGGTLVVTHISRPEMTLSFRLKSMLCLISAPVSWFNSEPIP